MQTASRVLQHIQLKEKKKEEKTKQRICAKAS